MQNYHSTDVKLATLALATTVLREKAAPHVIWEDANGALHQANASHHIRGHVVFPQTVSLMKNANELNLNLWGM